MSNELGDDEVIDPFAMPQGMFTPSFSVIRIACFADFRVDLSIDYLRTSRD